MIFLGEKSRVILKRIGELHMYIQCIYVILYQSGNYNIYIYMQFRVYMFGNCKC